MKHCSYCYDFIRFVNGEMNHVGVLFDRQTMDIIISNLKEWVFLYRDQVFVYSRFELLSKSNLLIIVIANTMLESCKATGSITTL